MLIVITAAPLAESSASCARVWSLSSFTLLLGIEFVIDEEALPPFLQYFAYGSLSPSGILNKRKLVAIDAGNRGYPPNKGLPRLCCGKIQSLGKHLLHILSSTPRHPNLIEHTSEKAKEAKDIQNRSQTEDETCIENTRMDRCAFHALCNMLKRGRRLEPSRNMGVEEMVAMFLHIIAHDVKIRVIKRQFVRSEETIS
ncbi:hypothetical protein HN51_066211, partial [Arachis hypogaea]